MLGLPSKFLPAQASACAVPSAGHTVPSHFWLNSSRSPDFSPGVASSGLLLVQGPESLPLSPLLWHLSQL